MELRSIISWVWIIGVCLFAMACAPESTKSDMSFGPPSEAIIRVQLNQDLQDTIDVSASYSHLLLNSRSFTKELSISKKGEYLLKLNIARPTIAQLKINEKYYRIPVYPSETSQVSIEEYHLEDGNNLIRAEYEGKGKTITEYFIDKEEALGYYDVVMIIANMIQSNSTYNRLKDQADSVAQVEIDYFEKYIARQDLPKWFLVQEENQLRYNAPAFKTGIKAANDVLQYFQDTIDEDYYSFLKEVDIDNNEAISSVWYYQFLKYYFCKDLDKNSTEFKELSSLVASMKLSDSALRGADEELTGVAQKYFKQYIFSDVIELFSDTSEVDSLALIYGIDEYKHLLAGLGTRIANENPDFGLFKGDTIPLLLLVDSQEELRSLKEFGDKIAYINIWATWCGACIKNFPEYNKMIDKYKDDERVQFINICMRSERDKWLKLINKHELGGINLYASGNWNDKLGAIFSLKGIPHYVLLDRENILDANFAEKAPYAQKAIDKLIAGSQ